MIDIYIFLKIFDVNDGQKYFNVGSRFDIYILKNNLDNKSTEVHVKKNSTRSVERINFKKWNFIPNHSFNLFTKLLKSSDEEGLEVLYNSSYYHSQKQI